MEQTTHNGYVSTSDNDKTRAGDRIASVNIPKSPQQLSNRSSEQVFRDHLDAINSGELDRIATDYAPDAFIMLTHQNSPIIGVDGIKEFFRDIYAATGGPADISIKSLTAHGDLVTVEWSLTSPKLTVVDGVETFLISKGLIVGQSGRLGGLSVAQ